MRLWALIWQAILGYLVSIVIGLIALVFMVVDLIIELLANRDGLSRTSKPGEWVERFIMWSVEQTLFSITGKGEFEWWP